MPTWILRITKWQHSGSPDSVIHHAKLLTFNDDMNRNLRSAHEDIDASTKPESRSSTA
jgi:hypothetical protein